ncbi:peroxisomal succinyl-coenzyme A thioesterase-like isoform X2 [Esox lucius]|uniref:peroxisomal succinyl-coenzyme A thioesterase-like isoform X2 n=1 Tax=Esox lucius TaxID=8010 RepID=UPI00147719B1|nr:peroxisomal succinyl-coenzyme A thioesterase-like isoform X2 [Esox lucius]
MLRLSSCCRFASTAARTSYFPARVKVTARGHMYKKWSSTMAAISPILTVQPTRGLVDEKIMVVVKNLPQCFAVTLHSLLYSEGKDYWEAFGNYTSDDKGTVTVSQDASVGGTYEGTEPMGLLWSMQPVPGSRPGLRLRKMNVLTPMVVHISVYSGHVTEGFSKQSPLATVDIERWYLAPGVRRIDIRENGVKGTLFIPPGTKALFCPDRNTQLCITALIVIDTFKLLDRFTPGSTKLYIEVYRMHYLQRNKLQIYSALLTSILLPFCVSGPGPFPGVLDLWGGGGGLVEYRSGLLASHGFVSMALEYLSSEISASNVDDKYFEPRCCVCVSGSHVQPVNKSLSEFFSKFTADMNSSRWDDEGRLIVRDITVPIPTEPGEKVDVGRIKCPVILIVGEDDQSWATVESAEDITQMMRAAGNEHLLTTFRYPGAGHLIEPPYTPHVRASNFKKQNTRDKVVMLWGGFLKLHADAQEDSWEKILCFLQHHLYPRQDSVSQAKL